MLLKCCAQYMSRFGKLSSGHRTGKSQFSFQSQRRAISKNVQTTIQLQSFHVLARLCSKSFKLGFSSIWTENFQMYKLGFKEAEKPEIKLPTFVGWWRRQETCRETSASASLTTLKPLTVHITTNCGKFLKRWEYQATWPVCSDTCMQDKKQQLELDMEQQTSLKLGKECDKAIYRHPAYLTYMQNTSWEMPG